MATTAYTDPELNAHADFEASRYDALSFHWADPGVTGASETVIPRASLSWFAAGAAGVDVSQPALVGRAWSGLVLVDVPAGVDVTHVGFWFAGVFRASRPLRSVVTGPVTGWQVAVAAGPRA